MAKSIEEVKRLYNYYLNKNKDNGYITARSVDKALEELKKTLNP